ncbi:hypothetical protein ACO0LO_19275 [Undibacterium sp. TJN25]|uniref:hypothetical protein n=1 Tax=Undibacterium sp. TJN25 TaxID=3413056 RepID=UPI003BF41A5B
MAALSLVLTALSAFTFWLVIPLFVLPPLAFFFGYKAHKANKTKWAQTLQTSRITKLLSILPMVLAVAAFFLELYFMNTAYRV